MFCGLFSAGPLEDIAEEDEDEEDDDLADFIVEEDDADEIGAATKYEIALLFIVKILTYVPVQNYLFTLHPCNI